MLKVTLIGYKGKLGSLAHQWINESSSMCISHAIDRNDTLQSITPSVTDVALELSNAKNVYANTCSLLRAKIPCIVGASGIHEDDYASLNQLAKENHVPVWIIPNFSIGAVLLNQCAKALARFYEQAHILEAHHRQKLDSPSGTSLMVQKTIHNSNGHLAPISSVRLDGIIADQTVTFGAPGETLAMHHHTSDRGAFKRGILLALSQYQNQPVGLSLGLDHLLTL